MHNYVVSALEIRWLALLAYGPVDSKLWRYKLAGVQDPVDLLSSRVRINGDERFW
jgi:hypothetical protein